MRVLIGFDMDGVIIDSDNPSAGDWFRRVFTETLREFGIPQTEENTRALYIKNMRDNAEAFCRRFGIDDPHLLWERREAHYVSEKLTALETGMIALYPDVVALEDLSREYPLALVSNSPQVVVDRVVSHFSLADIFRVWIGRGSSLEDLSRAKPAPDLLERMKAALKGTRGYYVGDQPEDVEAARAASLHPILLTRNGTPGDIRSLTELEGHLERLKKLRD
jgi:beta-phosphoglucomutase-like phosphatase (HAD superfamily)